MSIIIFGYTSSYTDLFTSLQPWIRKGPLTYVVTLYFVLSCNFIT